MIEHVTNPQGTTLSAKVFHDDGTFELEAVQQAPDFADLIDTLEDKLAEKIEGGEPVNIKDLAIQLLNHAKREYLAEILVKLLALFGDSDNVKLDIEILIAASNLKLRDKPDSRIADEFGISRQVFSARKKKLLKKLDMSAPAHSKSQRACDNYNLSNRRNSNAD